jgi:hypothetical protein
MLLLIHSFPGVRIIGWVNRSFVNLNQVAKTQYTALCGIWYPTGLSPQLNARRANRLTTRASQTNINTWKYWKKINRLLESTGKKLHWKILEFQYFNLISFDLIIFFARNSDSLMKNILFILTAYYILLRFSKTSLQVLRAIVAVKNCWSEWRTWKIMRKSILVFNV